MKEDEYIDLDKINVTPNGEEMPGFSKEQKDKEMAQKDKKEKSEPNKEAKPKPEKTIKTNNKPTKKATTKKTEKKKPETTKKKTTKNKKPKKTKNKTNNKTLLYLLLGIILLAIIILAITTIYEPIENSKESKVIALVNGEPLSEEEVETRGIWLKTINGMDASQEQILNLSVDIELLYQEAKKRNMSTNEEEINKVFEDMAKGVEFTQEELENYLVSVGIKTEVLREIIKKEMVAGELIEQETQPTITQEELEQYYENNKHLFVHDELAKVRHIQISNTNKTDNETYNETLKIRNKITENKTNFCELVENYTYDLNTKDTCGEYVFEKQETYPDEFSNKSFTLDDDELEIVKTEAGYHILWKVETIPSGISEFEDVKESIELQLKQEKSEQLYMDLLENLRANATIEYYTGQEQQPPENIEDELNTMMNETEDIITNETIIESDDEEQEENQTTNNETTLQENVTESEEQEENQTQNITTDEELDTLEDENITITYEETKNLEEDETRKLKLAKCLTNKGAKMYNVYWSPHGEEQQEAFNDAAEHLIIIECDADGVNPKITECKNTLKGEYPTWPTWKINGELYEGYQNLNKLAKIAGCEY